MKIEILDSTLRDGAQGDGISYSVDDKIGIVRCLDSMGIDFIEAGFPAANPKELEFFRRIQSLPLKTSKIVAFGSTRKPAVLPDDDLGLRTIAECGVTYITIFGKSWDLHVRDVLKTSYDENIQMIFDTCNYLTSIGKTVIFDAEHFFDGYSSNPVYALSSIRAAERGGASRIVLCDTNGGYFPNEIYDITKAAISAVSVPIGIHCHNDSGCAVANSIMAVHAGASHLHGTYLGFGERCGNASLSTLIPDLQLKLGYNCIPQQNMQDITPAARYISEITNISIPWNTPFIGKSAFAHKAGMHVDGVIKNSVSFEHIKPESVGNKRHFLLSEVSGRNAVFSKIKQIDPSLEKNSSETEHLISKLKKLEHEGYSFEAAQASFEIMILKHLGKLENFFTLEYFKIIGEQFAGESETPSTAVIKISVDGTEEITAAQGEGPINALDIALRKALEVFYPSIKNMRLIDYKVRVLEGKNTTAAKVRVLIESADENSVWATVGVSVDIINASWSALVDSIHYKLMKDTSSSL